MVWKYRRIIVVALAIVGCSGNSGLCAINDDIKAEIIASKVVVPEQDASHAASIHSIDNSNQYDINNVDPANKKYKIKNNTKLIKENLPLNGAEKAEIYYKQGLQAIHNHQEIEAATLLKKALTKDPEHNKARIQLVQLYQKIGWHDEIEKLLQQGLDLDPNNADFIKNLAMLYYQKNQPRKSLAILLAMPESYINDSDYLALLALTYLHADQPETAEKYYQQLLSINKENSIWWLGLAITQHTIGNYKSAVESFNQAKNLGRFNAETLDYINNQIEDLTLKF